MQTGSSIMGSAATSSNLNPSGTRIVDRESSGEKVDEDGSGFILISERSCAMPGREEKRIASANTMHARVNRKANCRVIIIVIAKALSNINYLPNIK